MPITVNVKGIPFEFEVSVQVYNKYINEMQPNNKVSPASNFLMRSIKAEQKEELREILELPGAPLQIAAAVIEEYAPDLEISVGK